ncbi:MAG: hypothetical protein KBF35_03720 [Saprospiraceae bacterium]|nr:hypothetical protein [Saprospiraceae bacterium]
MKNWNAKFYTCFFIMLNLTGIISCSNTGKPTDRKIENDILSRNDLGYLQLDGDSILIPDFEIEVSLSPKAEKKLKEDNETVIVSAMFSGTPKDTLSNEYQFMGLSVKNYNIELTTQRIARFDKVRFHSSILNKLSDADIFLLINVFSGRRSSENNILDVEILDNKMSVVKGKKYILKGKLIGEDD